MTVRGAAVAAGLAAKVWPNTHSLPQVKFEEFTAKITETGAKQTFLACSRHSFYAVVFAERDFQYERWKKAVGRCRHWTGREDVRGDRKKNRGEKTTHPCSWKHISILSDVFCCCSQDVAAIW